MVFGVGDKVVYPTHGVGKIESIEEKEVAGQQIKCYVLSILGKELKIIVPIFNAQKVGLREIIKEDEVEKVFDILREEINNMPPKWNKRYNVNMDKTPVYPSDPLAPRYHKQIMIGISVKYGLRLNISVRIRNLRIFFYYILNSPAVFF